QQPTAHSHTITKDRATIPVRHGPATPTAAPRCESPYSPRRTATDAHYPRDKAKPPTYDATPPTAQPAVPQPRAAPGRKPVPNHVTGTGWSPRTRPPPRPTGHRPGFPGDPRPPTRRHPATAPPPTRRSRRRRGSPAAGTTAAPPARG